jgi:hypothetical protein
VSPGFRIDNGVVIEVDASLAGYNEARGRSTYQRLLDRLRAVPGVESASMAATVPFGMISLGTRHPEVRREPPTSPSMRG